MIRHGIAAEDIEEVRKAVLRYAASENINYAEVARRAWLGVDDVKNFIYGRSASEGIIAYLVAYLPLEMEYLPPRIVPGKKCN